jgi:hypothetical protein
VSALSTKLNGLVWSSVNYDGTKLANNSDIPEVTDNAAWAALTTPAWCWYNNTADAAWRAKYKRIYNQHAVTAGLQVPSGWSVPTNAQYDALVTWMIANGHNWDGTFSGNKIGKSAASKAGEWTASGTAGHVGNAQSSNNLSGLTLLPGGFRDGITGVSSNTGATCILWTTTGRYQALSGAVTFAAGAALDARYGCSVRLVRALLTPTITSITRSGSTVTVTGTNFRPDEYAGTPTVTVNGSAVTPLSIGNTEVVFATSKSGLLTVRVTNNPDFLHAESTVVVPPKARGGTFPIIGLGVGVGL